MNSKHHEEVLWRSRKENKHKKKVLILLLLKSQAEQRLVGQRTQQQLSTRKSKSFVNEKLQCKQSIDYSDTD